MGGTKYGFIKMLTRSVPAVNTEMNSLSKQKTPKICEKRQKEGSSIDMDATALAAQSARAPENQEIGTKSAVKVLEPSKSNITWPKKALNIEYSRIH